MSWNHRLISTTTDLAIAFVTALSILSCSQYQPQSTIVAQEDLATYNPKNFSNKPQTSKAIPLEDEWIIRAIWFEDQKNFKQSHFYYNKLYTTTKNDEYLIKEIYTASMAGILSKHFNKLQKFIKRHPDNVQAKRLLLSSSIQNKNYKEAQSIANDLVQKSSHPIDYELAANPYIFTANYTKAIELLKEAYKRTHNEDILLKITTLYSNYLGDFSSATQLLEKHRVEQGCTPRICMQLATIYSQQENLEKLASVYKSLYKSTKKEVYAHTLIETYMYQKNVSEAIKFLENDYKNDEVLYQLYVQDRNYKKAEQLLTPLMKNSKDPKWYAEAAIVLYENAENQHDKALLEKVVNNFEKALQKGIQNPVYLNYYGYTLINENIDINKGMSLLKRALENEPENTYYLDSLAWGYFKLDNCEKAYSIMKKVIEIEGLEEKELIDHWYQIKEKCHP